MYTAPFPFPIRQPHAQALSTDILIVGGGIAGLWLNARLRRAGYATVLVESASLGGGQSVKSQGIIHGGASTPCMAP